MRPFLYTAFALTAFAFNSILCRLALRGEEADAAGFTAVRLLAGAVALVILAVIWRSPRVRKAGTLNVSRPPLLTRGLLQLGSWLSALFLFAYAICFSLAYLNLSAGTGALILFGSVQLTMVTIALARGERPRPIEWIGFAIAIGGLVYLVLPGLESPPLVSSLLMATAGAAWGFYTLRGKGSSDPLGETTGNFLRTLPFAAIALIVFLPNIRLSNYGILLAVLSGAIASGVGYTVWYAALTHHTPTRAAVLQLSVPVIAAVLGILMLGEAATIRLGLAAAMILGGIGLTIFKK